MKPGYPRGKFETEEGEVCWRWLGLLDGPENPLGECDASIEASSVPPLHACNLDLDAESCKASGVTWEEGGAAEAECICP